MRQKVCMLLGYLPFLDGRIFENEVESLIKHGYKVTMIVPRKNGCLINIDGTPFRNRYLEKVFKYKGVKIVTYDQEKRTQNPLTDPLYIQGLREEADIYHAHELNSFYYGKEIKRELHKRGKKAKLIYDGRQLVPDPFSAAINKDTKEQWRKMLHESLKEADYVITVSESLKSWFLAIDPLLPVEVIYNSPPSSITESERETESKRLVVCHVGNFADKNEDLKKIYSITDSLRKVIDFQFKLIGGPRYGEVVDVPEHINPNILLNGWVDYLSLPNTMKDVDIGWIHLDVTSSLNNMFAMPNKLFNFLNNGIPVIVNKCSDMEKFICTYHCGLVIDKLNPTPADYTKAILYLHNNRKELKQMGINAKKAMEAYHWGNMEKRLLSIYDSLSGKETNFHLV